MTPQGTLNYTHPLLSFSLTCSRGRTEAQLCYCVYSPSACCFLLATLLKISAATENWPYASQNLLAHREFQIPFFTQTKVTWHKDLWKSRVGDRCPQAAIQVSVCFTVAGGLHRPVGPALDWGAHRSHPWSVHRFLHRLIMMLCFKRRGRGGTAFLSNKHSCHSD